MKNKFVYPDTEKCYDVVIMITTLPKAENKTRTKKVLELIEKYPPPMSYNVYLAYEGKDWADAVNIGFKRLLPRVKYGLILLDDDSFPMEDWMQGFETAIKHNCILQFAIVNPYGIVKWKTKV